MKRGEVEMAIAERLTHSLTSSIQEVALEAMAVDHNFQRAYNESRVRRMVQRFDPDLVGILTVSRRADGRYILLDGQQRWHVLVEKNYATAICEVFINLTLEREAEIYRDRNAPGQRVALREGDVFRSDLASGNPEALAIQKSVVDSGYEIEFALSFRHSGSVRPETIAAIGALRRIYRWGPEVLRRTLRIVRQSWAESGAYHTYGPLLMGIGAFVRLYPEVSDERVATKLSQFTAARILAQARSAIQSRTSIWLNVQDVIWTTYNRGQRSQILPRREVNSVVIREWARPSTR